MRNAAVYKSRQAGFVYCGVFGVGVLLYFSKSTPVYGRPTSLVPHFGQYAKFSSVSYPQAGQ